MHSMNHSEENNSNLINSMVGNFFKNINMNKLEYRNKATNVVSRNYDPYISPYNLLDPEAEKYFRTDLIKIMSASMESIASTGFTIERFPKDYLEKILILEAPKKIIQYAPSSSSNSIGTDISDVNKPKQARKSGPRGGKQQRSALLRSLPDVASIYAEEGHSRSSASEDYYKAKATSSIGNKRSHTESTSAIATGNRDKASSSSTAISPDQKPPIPKDKLPGNFYKVANELFDEFWAMEFDDVEITWAFFAKINFLNCKDYHLDDFAEESYSLAIIKDKLQNITYTSIDQFRFDFKQLFSNILTYYPKEHQAYRKAIELSGVFDVRWEQALTKFHS